jgi:hypothetical protein
VQGPAVANVGQFTADGRVFVSQCGKVQMTAKQTAGCIFIRENTILPDDLIIETETFLPGWRAVSDCDGYRLGRKIEEAKWNFFYLAGEFRAIVPGRLGPAAFRRAVRNILAKPEARKFNSLEITGIRSRWFLGIPFVSVAANFRHIQKSLALAPAKVPSLKIPAVPQKAMAGDKIEALVSSS